LELRIGNGRLSISRTRGSLQRCKARR